MQSNCIFPGRYAPLTYYEDIVSHIVMVWYVVLKIDSVNISEDISFYVIK